MGESALLRRSRCPIFTLHYAIVGCWAAERDPISLIIRAHARECTAARHQSFKVIDMRWFQIGPGRLDCDYRFCPATEWGRARGFHLRLPDSPESRVRAT